MKGQPIHLVNMANNPSDEEFYAMNDIFRMITRTAKWMSWGIHNPWKLANKVLFFSVQWFVLKWTVYISVQNDEFVITITDKKWIIQHELSWIWIENLVDVIDTRVEKNVSDTEYWKKVKWFFFWF